VRAADAARELDDRVEQERADALPAALSLDRGELAPATLDAVGDVPDDGAVLEGDEARQRGGMDPLAVGDDRLVVPDRGDTGAKDGPIDALGRDEGDQIADATRASSAALARRGRGSASICTRLS
jgi:hypothetical protein